MGDVFVFGNVKAERAAVEATYTDTCDIVRNVEKEINFINRHVDETVYKDVPCALVMGKSPTESTDTAAFFNYAVKIFMPPEIEVMAGDKIIVARYGRTVEYTNAGRSAVYATHQEVAAVENTAVSESENHADEDRP